MSPAALLSEAIRHHVGANLPAAAGLYRRALVLDPGLGDALNLLGMLKSDLDEGNGALRSLRRSLAIVPAEPSFLHNLGLAQLERSELSAAGKSQRRALAMQPDFVESVFDLGNALMRSGHHLDALRLYRRTVTLAPGHVSAHQNLGWNLLTLGRFEEGWTEYSWRWRLPSFAALREGLHGRPWTAAAAAGRLLLYAEQGLGDTLQFCRFASLASERVRDVVLEVQPELVTLLKRSLPAVDVRARSADLTAPGARPSHDWHASLLDLPGLFRTEIGTIPDRIPYLVPDAAMVQRWRTRLDAAALGALRVGLAWAGGARADQPRMAAVDRRRSLALAQFGGLGRLDRVRFFSLQKGHAASEAATRPDGLRLIDFSPEIADFDDTAAIVAGLDLVVTVDTAVAHLAGALGKPVWVLSRFDGCWRWLTDRQDSPWYPTLRLYRQRAPGEWGPVLDRIAGDVAALAAGKTAS